MRWNNWNKLIAIVVLVAFIGTGIVWAAEPGGPGFMEKESKPVLVKHRHFPWLLVILGAVAVGAGVYFLFFNKKETGPQYRVRVDGRSLTGHSPVGGSVTFRLDNGSSVTCDNGSEVVFKGSNKVVGMSVSGQGDYFPNDLVVADENDDIVGWFGGNSKSFSVSNGQRIFVEYVKNAGFDFQRYKRCLQYGGVVVRYDNPNKELNIVKCAYMNAGVKPSSVDIGNFVSFLAQYNEQLKDMPSHKVSFDNVGETSAALPDGATYGTANSPAGHVENLNGNVIHDSHFFTMSEVNLGLVLAEGDGALSGRGDGGSPTNPYVDDMNNCFTPEGKFVILLHYCLPIGYAPNGSAAQTMNAPTSMSTQSLQTGSFQSGSFGINSQPTNPGKKRKRSHTDTQ